MNTLQPVEPPYSDEVTHIFTTYPQRDGYVLKLFRVFANSIRFLKKGTLNLLDRDSPVTLRERELVILRTCANNGCEYEWGVHVGAFAEAAGLDEAQIVDTTRPALTPALWSAQEHLLLKVVDGLCTQGGLGADLRTQFQCEWDATQQLEIMALCGNYHTISFVANVAAVESEAFAASFPPEAMSRSE